MIKGVRVKKEEPLFSRYLFIKLDITNTNWTSIRSTRGVTKFVEFGGGASIVDPLIIKSLLNMESQPEESYLTHGETVRSGEWCIQRSRGDLSGYQWLS